MLASSLIYVVVFGTLYFLYENIDFPGYCGYLASMASMAGGADAGYIFEEKFGITELKRDLDSMVSKMDKKMVYRWAKQSF